MYDKVPFYALILAVGVVGAVGDAFLNHWAKFGGTRWLMAGYVGWLVTASIFAYMLKRELFGSAVVLFLLSNIMFALLISHFYFSERLSAAQWGGIALAILAIIVMETRN